MHQPPEPCAAGAPARKTILVVDDDEDVRSLLRATLAGGPHRVLEAADGAEALGLIGRCPPDLVLLNVHLPGLDGPTVCRQLKADAATRAIPVLMVSAATEEADRARGLAAGADGYVTKPFSPRALLDRLGAELDRGQRRA
jgi:two-component system phosphate regulon response regulator PhoB